MLGQRQTQFMGSKFGIFGGFGWVHSSILVETWGWKGSRLSFFKFGTGFDLFLAKQVQSFGLLEGGGGFEF